ncbi:hypothetical protein Tsubulata_005425, partial [Turnera subulata]
ASVSMDNILTLHSFTALLLIIPIITATDTINITQSIRDGDTLIAAGGMFELGFFSPGNSKNRYLGIWYTNISPITAVWVANRDNPLTDSSGILRLTGQGILLLLNRSESIIWSSNSSRTARNPVAQLLDSSNLVVKERSDDDNLENSLWQSFDYIGDTLMAGMKHGRNIRTGLDRYFTSWKSPGDPSSGAFTFRLDSSGYSELILREGSIDRFRPGPWNGFWFSGKAVVRSSSPIHSYEFVTNDEETYYTYTLVNSSLRSRFVLNQNGSIQCLNWVDPTRGWVLYLTVQTDTCDRYDSCGAYAICDINNVPTCNCLKGFVPKDPRNWDLMNSNGCVRRTSLNCSGDGFQKYIGLKMPDTRKSWFNKSMTLGECKNMCKNNCSCTAYANLDIRNGGSGCLLWFHELVDIKQVTENLQEIFIRIAGSDLDNGEVNIGTPSDSKKQKKIVISSVLSVATLLVVLAFVCYYWRKKLQRDGKLESNPELPLFDLETVARATNDFSGANKLGQGGYGPVYKGMLKDGREIAVKRLSKNSRQGHDEFKNEVMSIVNLQHRNLVKLLGCCIQGDEKMLIYEFMPNKSLDFFIFGLTLETHEVAFGLAWSLFMEGRCQELIAGPVMESCNLSEVLRSIHVGLLCVQSSPKDRPTMSSVVHMFAGEGELPPPKQPGFFMERDLEEAGGSSSNYKPSSSSANTFTITQLEA